MQDYEVERVRVRSTVERSFLRKSGMLLVLVVLVAVVWASIAYVPAGHVGVLTLFGRVTGQVLPEGTHLVNSFTVNHRMSVRTQELKETASVPSQEGLIITLDTSLLFRLDPAKASDVYRSIGPRYEEVVVEPNLRSAIREATASHSANALYSSDRERVAQRIMEQLGQELGRRGVVVESIYSAISSFLQP